MFHKSLFSAVFLVTALLGTTLSAQETARRAPDAAPETGIFSLLPGDAVTHHLWKSGTGELAYTATAGMIDLRGQDGAVAAKVFYTAYIADRSGPNRPLTFAFNGGPGAASAYLHLGLAGPRLLDFGPNGNDGTRPQLKDNPQSWLGFTDLVLIDPVGTGWSRAANKDATSSFYGVRQDAESLAKVIALYIQSNNRLAAPKFLLGESYGGFRAAKVAGALKSKQGILVSGIVMVSPLIDSRLIFGATDYPLGAALQLPSIAAAELERKNAFSTEAIAQAERFSMTDYMTMLAGPSPEGAAATTFYQRVAQMTGIPQDSIAKTRGFVGDLYTKQMRASTGDIVSPYDASYGVSDPYPEDLYNRSDDPILDGFTRAYGAAFPSYARSELGFKTDMTYQLLADDVNRAWDWADGRDGSRDNASVGSDIRDLLATISSFRLLVAHGYSDALTPYGATRYVLDHLPPRLAKGRAELKVYRGGHMFYTRDSSRQEMTRDIRAFYDGMVGSK